MAKNQDSPIGYLVPEFPSQTHIFFWREISAIRKMGRTVRLLSTSKSDLSKVKHDFAEPASKETHYIFPPGAAALTQLLLHPLWLVRSIKYCLNLNAPLKEKLRVLAFIPSSADLLTYCKRTSIKHVHGHSCANVAHVLAMCFLSGQLTYSLTLHGGLNVYGENHKEKMKNAKFVSAVTRPLQKEICNEVGLAIDRVPVIWMGVDLEKFEPKSKELLSDSPLRFITVARLSVGKGHVYALEALARIKNKGIAFHYTIVGGGPDENMIIQDIERLKLNANVTMAGSLGEEDVVKIIGEADVLLLTSTGLFEAAPVCVMEAMASGIPVISSIIGGTPDMIDDEVNGFLVEQKNIDQIEAAITKISLDQELRRRMSIAARKNAEENFEYITQAKLLLERIEKPLL